MEPLSYIISFTEAPCDGTEIAYLKDLSFTEDGDGGGGPKGPVETGPYTGGPFITPIVQNPSNPPYYAPGPGGGGGTPPVNEDPDPCLNANGCAGTALALPDNVQLAIKIGLGVQDPERDWLLNDALPSQFQTISDFVEDNQNSNGTVPVDVQELARNIIEFWMENGQSEETDSYVQEIFTAKTSNDYTAFFQLDIFNNDPYNIWRSLTESEKDLIIDFPMQAYEIFRNRDIAENATALKFGNNGLNDKSDAFRHAYYNAINTMDVGSFMSKQFSDAHENEVPMRYTLEKQMDLFNNSIGHDASISYTNHTDTELIEDYYQEVLNGDLKYLNPINYNDPNFWDDPNTTFVPNDGTHGIMDNTSLIPTDL